MNPTSKTPPDDLVMQALDPNKVQLICSLHNYTGFGQVGFHPGCHQCNMINMVLLLARAKNPREEFEKLEALIHAMCELEDEGKLDIQINAQPVVTIERDVDA